MTEEFNPYTSEDYQPSLNKKKITSYWIKYPDLVHERLKKCFFLRVENLLTDFYAHMVVLE